MLENITVKQLKEMSLKQLLALCEEARELITATVFKNGGHLSSNLGTEIGRASCRERV